MVGLVLFAGKPVGPHGGYPCLASVVMVALALSVLGGSEKHNRRMSLQGQGCSISGKICVRGKHSGWEAWVVSADRGGVEATMCDL